MLRPVCCLPHHLNLLHALFSPISIGINGWKAIISSPCLNPPLSRSQAQGLCYYLLEISSHAMERYPPPNLPYLQRGLGPVTIDPGYSSGPHRGMMMIFALEAHDGTRWCTSRFWVGLPPYAPSPQPAPAEHVCTPYICHAIALRSCCLRLGEVITALIFGSPCDKSL